MKKKASKPITSTEELSKDCTYLDALYNPSFIFFPGKEEWRKRIIFALRTWSKQEKSYVFQKFLDRYNIPKRTWLFWVKEHDDIAKAYEDAKIALAANRQDSGMNYEINWTAAVYDMHRLDPEWEEQVDNYKANKKKQETEANTSVTVIMESYDKENE